MMFLCNIFIKTVIRVGLNTNKDKKNIISSKFVIMLILAELEGYYLLNESKIF